MDGGRETREKQEGIFRKYSHLCMVWRISAKQQGRNSKQLTKRKVPKGGSFWGNLKDHKGKETKSHQQLNII